VGIFAEFERENLSERTRLGFERKAKEGYSLCSHISSFGYNRENGNRIQEINEEEAATVRRIFKMYLHDDFTFSQIADTLNNENVTTKLNKAWITRGVRNVLSNPNYVGKVRYSMEDETRYFEVDGHHAPIVDETTYYQVQEKIGKIQKITKTKRPTEEVYFCGVLSCKLCGGKYTTHWQHRKDTATGKTITHVSYRCVNKNSTLQKCCNAKIIAHSKVEKAFENYLANYEDCQTQTEKPQQDNSAEIATMTAEVKQIEKKTAEIINLFVANSIDFPTYQGMVKASNERRGELESRLILLQNAQKEKSITYNTKDIITNFRKNWGKLKNEERLKFMQKFIKKVIVYSNPEKYHGDIIIDEILFNAF
jgi:site-specific DNA recombinase